MSHPANSPQPVVRPPGTPSPAATRRDAVSVFVALLLLAGCRAPPETGPPVMPSPPPVSEPPSRATVEPEEVDEGAPPGAALPAAPVPVEPAVTTRDGVLIDRGRGEIRVPCFFVNPTRLLEVFACHHTGPTHETVLEFDVNGPDLYRGLRALGLRSARYWNGTSPDDFLRNQGDRVLVLVRWEHAGRVHEYPAEALLLDGPSGFPAFIRGFSLSTRAVLPEERGEGPGPSAGGAEGREGVPDDEGAPPPPEAREPEVPEVVEITLGATNRQSPSYSLLTHPTHLPRLVRWMVPPELDTRVVERHEELVAKRVPATLILRRLASEVELIDVAERIALDRGQDDRAALYQALRPIAATIDRLKAEYEALLGEIREFLGGGIQVEQLGEEEKARRAARGLELLRRGQGLCARIEERYLTQYAMEEELKASWAERQEGLIPEIRDEVLVLARSGVAFEPRLAAKRVELAELELSESALPAAERNLRRERIRKEAELIELERQRQLAEANLRHVRSRLEGLDPEKDSYQYQLFQEDERHFLASIRALTAKQRIARSELAELKALLDGTWDRNRDSVLAERERGALELQAAELDGELVEVLEKIRWATNDLRSGVAERAEDARRELEEAEDRKAAIEARIERIEAKLREPRD